MNKIIFLEIYIDQIWLSKYLGQQLEMRTSTEDVKALVKVLLKFLDVSFFNIMVSQMSKKQCS